METNGSADEYRFLREEIVYSSPWFYYFGIIEDFILRFAWTFTVSVTHDKVLKSQVSVMFGLSIISQLLLLLLLLVEAVNSELYYTPHNCKPKARA